MSDIDNSINNLKRLTKELAEEIKYDEIGPLFKFCKLICDNLKTMVIIIDLKSVIRYMNPSCIKYLKEHNIDIKVGDLWFKAWNLEKDLETHPIKDAIEQRMVIHKSFVSPLTKNTFDVVCIPLIFNGVSGTITLMNQVA